MIKGASWKTKILAVVIIFGAASNAVAEEKTIRCRNIGAYFGGTDCMKVEHKGVQKMLQIDRNKYPRFFSADGVEIKNTFRPVLLVEFNTDRCYALGASCKNFGILNSGRRFRITIPA